MVVWVEQVDAICTAEILLIAITLLRQSYLVKKRKVCAFQRSYREPPQAAARRSYLVLLSAGMTIMSHTFYYAAWCNICTI